MKKEHPFVELRNINIHFKHLHVLHDVSLSIDERQLIVVMGPNGAGKSTVLKALFGIAPLSSGSVLINGHEILPEPITMRGLGIAFVTQGKRVFPTMTVEENIRIGAYDESDKQVIENRLQEMLDLFPILNIKRHQHAGGLSGGQQQMVAIARGLMSDPKLLLLDEPTLGLSPKMVSEVFDALALLRQQKGIAMMVVEHNIKTLLPTADSVDILSRGNLVFSGSGADIMSSNILEEVFLK
jgi:branched-chain amino acid transport system ATP-binding protein